MNVEQKRNLQTAPQFWGNLLSKYPIVAITGITYDPKPHGVPSNNKPIQEHEGILLDWTLTEGEVPYFGPIYYRKNSVEKNPQTFAVGAIVYIWEGCEEESPFLEAKAFTKYEVYEREHHLKDLEQLGINAKAIVMADIDLPINDYNFGIIISTLKEKYAETGWTLFETDNGYHLVFNKFVNPKEIPIHYANLIESFIDLAQNDKTKRMVKDFVDIMYHFHNSPKHIEFLCEYILENVSHYSENDSKLHYPVDLRSVAHSLLEWTKYIESKKGSFGYLRISDKSGIGSQPRAVAKHELSIS